MRQVAILARIPSGPAFTVVLVLHVAAAALGAVTLAAGASAAMRLVSARDGEVPRSVRVYFSPGPNLAGRVLWLVPVLGIALLVMSGGAYGLGDSWVVAGLGLWVASIALCEGVVWRAERRIRDAIERVGPEGSTPDDAVRAGRVVRVAAPGVVVLIAVATVVMLAKP